MKEQTFPRTVGLLGGAVQPPSPAGLRAEFPVNSATAKRVLIVRWLMRDHLATYGVKGQTRLTWSSTRRIKGSPLDTEE
jgi:hypothetical protein